MQALRRSMRVHLNSYPVFLRQSFGDSAVDHQFCGCVYLIDITASAMQTHAHRCGLGPEPTSRIPSDKAYVLQQWDHQCSGCGYFLRHRHTASAKGNSCSSMRVLGPGILHSSDKVYDGSSGSSVSLQWILDDIAAFVTQTSCSSVRVLTRTNILHSLEAAHENAQHTGQLFTV
jgi:hypothetical protein